LNRYKKNGLLLDAAVEKGNEDLVVSLAQQFNGSLSFKSFKTIIDFLKSKDNPNLSLIQNSLITKVPEDKELLDFALENNMTILAKKLAAKCVSIKNYDYVGRLASKRNPEYSDIIIVMLQNYPVKGHPLAPGHYSYNKLHLYHDAHLDSNNDEYDAAHYDYCNWLSEYNQICDRVLDFAISNQNNYLAQKVLPLFKKNIETVVAGPGGEVAGDGEKVEYYSCYVRHYTADISAARKKYQEAVRSGAFK
jgi:hypothetical protein